MVKKITNKKTHFFRRETWFSCKFLSKFHPDTLNKGVDKALVSQICLVHWTGSNSYNGKYKFQKINFKSYTKMIFRILPFSLFLNFVFKHARN